MPPLPPQDPWRVRDMDSPQRILQHYPAAHLERLPAVGHCPQVRLQNQPAHGPQRCGWLSWRASVMASGWESRFA